jgi:hypothetical protein
VVRDCAFVSNRVVGLGGGLAIDLGVNLTINGCTFEGNTAGSGGGIAVSAATAAITDCDISGNTATFGGGLCLLSAVETEVADTEITSNMACLEGGGLYSADASYCVRRSTITENAAGTGGALWLLGSEGLVTQTVVADNSAGGLAGGFFIDASPTTISSCDFTGNGLAVHVVTPSRALADARLNWWGDSSGPYHPILNPAGLGDEVSDSVQFAPWNVTADAPEHPVVVRSTWGTIKAIHR